MKYESRLHLRMFAAAHGRSDYVPTTEWPWAKLPQSLFAMAPSMRSFEKTHQFDCVIHDLASDQLSEPWQPDTLLCEQDSYVLFVLYPKEVEPWPNVKCAETIITWPSRWSRPAGSMSSTASNARFRNWPRSAPTAAAGSSGTASRPRTLSIAAPIARVNPESRKRRIMFERHVARVNNSRHTNG